MDSQQFLGLAGQGREGCRCQKGEVLLNANNLGHYDCHCIKMWRKNKYFTCFLEKLSYGKKGSRGKIISQFCLSLFLE